MVCSVSLWSVIEWLEEDLKVESSSSIFDLWGKCELMDVVVLSD